jgi:two-component system sensor histidine kinase YesM
MVPLTISLSLSALYNGRELQEKNISLQLQRISYTAQHINNQFAIINNNLRVFSKQAAIRELFRRSNPNRINEKTIRTVLSDLCYVYPDYSNAYICSVARQQVYSAYPESNGVVSYEELRISDWYANVTRQYEYAVSIYPFSNGRYIACIRSQRDPVSLRFEGYVMVKVKTAVFDNAFKTFSDDDTALHCITEAGELITEQTSAAGLDYGEIAVMIAKNPGNRSVYYKDYIICWESLRHANILIFTMLPRSAWHLWDMLPGMIGGLLTAICIIIGLYLSISYLRRFLKPISRLAETMQNADPNNLEHIRLSRRNDEIAVLERCYNNMVDNFNQLLNREYRASLAAQEAQIRSLQLQINPHFVNNTLQMIGAIAVEHGIMDIYELLKSFSNIFYYCIKFKGNKVSLKDELDYLTNYINIQNKRYPGRFEISIQTDEQVNEYEIPKMTLQPIVENCFSHAFRFIEDIWQIRIASSLSGGICEIQITDNGGGLSADDLQALRLRIRETGSTNQFTYSGSIGLRNVNTRMRLLYGEEYQLRIDSAPGAGTAVTLRLPQKTEGESSHDQSDDSG